ncbi:MAG: MarR family transcriptional regulator [Planctomycetes bacterium]|nr:MarR family transcriptional regulator [Planctomycetota bacterium]
MSARKATAIYFDEGSLDAPQKRRLPPLLRRAWYGLNQAFRRRISHLAITPDQFTILRTLGEASPTGLSQRELVEKMSSDPNTISSLLKRMEKGGFLERSAHESDKRAHRIRLKPAGKKAYKDARRVALELQREVLEAVGEAEMEAFLVKLEVVANACRDAADRSPQ